MAFEIFKFRFEERKFQTHEIDNLFLKKIDNEYIFPASRIIFSSPRLQRKKYGLLNEDEFLETLSNGPLNENLLSTI